LSRQAEDATGLCPATQEDAMDPEGSEGIGRIAGQTHATRRHIPLWEIVVNVLMVAALGGALGFGFLSTILPFEARGGSHLSDIALLLLVAGLPYPFVAFGFFLRRTRPLVWAELRAESRPSWSLLATLVGLVVVGMLTVWEAAADLASPPSAYGRAVELPAAAQLAFLVAFIVMLLGPLIGGLEYTWRFWRAQRASASRTKRG
jgi:hypothetical protein